MCNRSFGLFENWIYTPSSSCITRGDMPPPPPPPEKKVYPRVFTASKTVYPPVQLFHTTGSRHLYKKKVLYYILYIFQSKRKKTTKKKKKGQKEGIVNILNSFSTFLLHVKTMLVLILYNRSKIYLFIICCTYRLCDDVVPIDYVMMLYL